MRGLIPCWGGGGMGPCQSTEFDSAESAKLPKGQSCIGVVMIPNTRSPDLLTQQLHSYIWKRGIPAEHHNINGVLGQRSMTTTPSKIALSGSGEALNYILSSNNTL